MRLTVLLSLVVVCFPAANSLEAAPIPVTGYGFFECSDWAADRSGYIVVAGTDGTTDVHMEHRVVSFAPCFQLTGGHGGFDAIARINDISSPFFQFNLADSLTLFDSQGNVIVSAEIRGYVTPVSMSYQLPDCPPSPTCNPLYRFGRYSIVAEPLPEPGTAAMAALAIAGFAAWRRGLKPDGRA